MNVPLESPLHGCQESAHHVLKLGTGSTTSLRWADITSRFVIYSKSLPDTIPGCSGGTDWELIGGDLPGGLALDSDGLLHGAVTEQFQPTIVPYQMFPGIWVDFLSKVFVVHVTANIPDIGIQTIRISLTVLLVLKIDGTFTYPDALFEGYGPNPFSVMAVNGIYAGIVFASFAGGGVTCDGGRPVANWTFTAGCTATYWYGGTPPAIGSPPGTSASINCQSGTTESLYGAHSCAHLSTTSADDIAPPGTICEITVS